jgi:hypothetical protein
LERFVLGLVEHRLTSQGGQVAAATTTLEGLQAAAGTQVPLASVVSTGQATASGTSVDLATVGPSVTIPVAGTYTALFGVEATAGAAVTPSVGVAVNGVIAAGDERRTTIGAAAFVVQIGGAIPDRAFAAGDVLRLMYRSAGAVSTTFSLRWLVVLRLS